MTEPRDVLADEALMTAYVAGDRLAFFHLFRRLAPRVRGFFLRSFRDPALADDLVQQTFLKVHRARDAFRGDSPLKGWVFAIAARVRLDELRRRRRLPETADEDALVAAEEAQAVARVAEEDDARARAELSAQVVAALDELPESQRVVIHLHRYEGLSYAEIAGILGTTEGAIKLRAFRGYERLRERLKPLVGGAP